MRKDRFTDEALRNARALAELKMQDSEQFSEAYDFARCQRPDGSFYGTSGQCRKGTEAGAAPPREGTGARGGRVAAEKAKAEGKKGVEIRKARREGTKAAVEAARAAGGAKTSAKNARARMLKDELSKIRDRLKGKSPEEINKALAAALERASARAAAGEGKAAKKAPVRVGKTGERAENVRSRAQEAYNKARAIGKREAEAVARLRKDPQNKDLLRQVQMLRTERANEDARYNSLTKKAKKLEREQGKAPIIKERAERTETAKMGRTASQLTPKEQAARAERQKANEANRQAQAGAAGAARRAGSDAKREERRQRDNELRGMIRDKMADQRGRKGELDRLERAYKDQARKVKAEPTKEGKARLKEVARQLRERERFFNRGERELEKMGRERMRIAQQNERERMTPAQRAEAARVRKIIKERG